MDGWMDSMTGWLDGCMADECMADGWIELNG